MKRISGGISVYGEMQYRASISDNCQLEGREGSSVCVMKFGWSIGRERKERWRLVKGGKKERKLGPIQETSGSGGGSPISERVLRMTPEPIRIDGIYCHTNRFQDNSPGLKGSKESGRVTLREKAVSCLILTP